MDKKLQSALEYADYNKSITVQRQFLKEKLDSDLTFGYNGGIFKIDQTLINFTQFLIDKNRVTDIPLIDVNKNPILINDIQQFQSMILDRYFSAVNYYIDKIGDLKKARSTVDLINL
jgi:hypothetical protein